MDNKLIVEIKEHIQRCKSCVGLDIPQDELARLISIAEELLVEVKNRKEEMDVLTAALNHYIDARKEQNEEILNLRKQIQNLAKKVGYNE